MKTIKYKKSTGDFVKKIDIKTGSVMAEFNTSQRDRYIGLIKEMETWKDNGNEIEPQFTIEELKKKESKDLIDALENQESKLLNLIKDNEYHLYNDEYLGDRETWKTLIAKWHSQKKEVKAGKLVEIEPKPVFK